MEMEKLLGRALIYLACRHHVLELIVKELFEELVEPSSGPDIGKLCKNFKKAWKTIDQTNYVAVTSNKAYREILTPERIQSILDFAFKALEVNTFLVGFFLKQKQTKLTLVFAGETNSCRLQIPIGVDSHFSRW